MKCVRKHGKGEFWEEFSKKQQNSLHRNKLLNGKTGKNSIQFGENLRKRRKIGEKSCHKLENSKN